MNSQSSLASISELEKFSAFHNRNNGSLSGLSEEFGRLQSDSQESDYNPYQEFYPQYNNYRHRSMPNFETAAISLPTFNYGYDTEEVLHMRSPTNRDKIQDIMRISQDIDNIDQFDTSVLSERLFEIAQMKRFGNIHSNQGQQSTGNYRLNHPWMTSKI